MSLFGPAAVICVCWTAYVCRRRRSYVWKKRSYVCWPVYGRSRRKKRLEEHQVSVSLRSTNATSASAPAVMTHPPGHT